MTHRPLVLDGTAFSLQDAARVLAGEVFPVKLSRAAEGAMRASRAMVDLRVRSTEPIYGINTGFGKLSKVRIKAESLEELQRNLILSHAAGVGDPLPPGVARLILLLRANALSRGYSGVRIELVQRLLDLFAAGVAPVIPEQGSVGASGDLAPLAHLALLLIGRGEGMVGGKRKSGAAICKQLGVEPLTLQAKEGLALINGTQASTAIAVSGLLSAIRLAKVADIAAAMSIEAVRGSVRPFDPRVHALRGHPGQQIVGRNVTRLLKGSQVLQSHKDCGRVQDPYAIRCAPQVHGAARDSIAHVEQVLCREMNAVTDNPLLFPDDDTIISQGNFHAEPVAMVADFAAIAVSELASIAERRVECLINPDIADSGLPPFLIPDAGLHSGHMITHVTAAALVSENKTLCHPASVDSIPTSAGKEDHVSMATWAARKLCRVVANAEAVLAIELLCGAQGLDLHPAPRTRPGKGVVAAHKRIRESVRFMARDREIAPDIALVIGLVRSGALLDATEQGAGKLE